MVEAKTKKGLGYCVMVRNGTFIKEHERLCPGKTWVFVCLWFVSSLA